RFPKKRDVKYRNRLAVSLHPKSDGQRRHEGNAATARTRFSFVRSITLELLLDRMARGSNGLALNRIRFGPGVGQFVQRRLELFHAIHYSFSKWSSTSAVR